MNDLRKLAEEATPGPWRVDPGPEWDPADYVIFGPDSQWLANVDEAQHAARWVSTSSTILPSTAPRIGDAMLANAAYIAAASPDVILGLLDRIAELERTLHRIAFSQESDLSVYAKFVEEVARAALAETESPARSSSKVETGVEK